VLFLALFALYSPVAALSSYLPIVAQFREAEQLSIGLFVNATGGIALIFASVPLMRGVGETAEPAPEEAVAEPAPAATGSLRSILLTRSRFR